MSGVAPEVWAAGEAYEPYVGRWSRPVARELLAWIGVPAGARWLDVGSGTGALSQTILAMSAPERVVGVDASSAFVTFVRRRIGDPRARFEVGDARDLPVERGSFDAVVSGLAINFVPGPDRAVEEMVRAARADGVVAAYVWDYAGRMELIRHFWDAAIGCDPGAAELDEGRRFPLCREAPLGDLFRGAGLAQVATRAIEVPTRFESFDDYWAPFLGGQGPAPAYAMSLDEVRRAALRERIRAGLPIGSDGSIDLVARAWAVRGRTRS